MLNAVCEADFPGFSYGFRPGRGPHQALDALVAGITTRRVNWVPDADIRDFFGQLDRGWLEKFLRHRIADERVLRLIGKWLAAGVIEDGEWTESEKGSPQGASASPLLANVYLHYVLDLWADWRRKRHADGDVVIVRFADDFIVGFEYQEDAERFLDELRGRFATFGLELHPGKTRLIEFGRHAARHRKARGLGKPETFDFPGFTHICATAGSGRFRVKRITISKRMRAKLKQVKGQLTQRMHLPVPEQGRWLASVLRGHMAYYAVPVASDGPPDVGAFRRSHHARAIRHLHDQDFRTFDLNDPGDFGKRRLSHVRDQRLDCQRVGPPRLVPGPGAADRPVILDAHEEHSAGPVGRTYHRLDEVAVVQLFSLLALELDLMGLPASDPLRDTQASPLSDPTASAPHTRSYATPSQAHRRPANAQDRPCRLRTSHRRQTSACLTAEHPVLARHQGWPGPGQ